MWTKPADWEVDWSQPFKGVVDAEGEFLAVLCDGACMLISKERVADSMVNLLKKDDGNVINW